MKISFWLQKKFFQDTRGFTLIELVIVMIVLSILFLVVTPRVSRIINAERNNFAIFTGMIVKTFDDAFLHNKTNYLIVHLPNPNPEEPEIYKDISNRRNAVSVVTLVDGNLVENPRRTLQWREFSPDRFRIDGVLRPNGDRLINGNILIPFYPQGYSDNVIIHILVNDEQQWSIKINKYIKEPKVIEGHMTFEPETER